MRLYITMLLTMLAFYMLISPSNGKALETKFSSLNQANNDTSSNKEHIFDYESHQDNINFKNNLQDSKTIYFEVEFNRYYDFKWNQNATITLSTDEFYTKVDFYQRIAMKPNTLYKLVMEFDKSLEKGISCYIRSVRYFKRNDIPEDLENPFLEFENECKLGYNFVVHTNTTSCKEQCGNGIKTEGEAWDDNNTNDGDGWSKDCKHIEPGWTWQYNSSIKSDEWTEVIPKIDTLEIYQTRDLEAAYENQDIAYLLVWFFLGLGVLFHLIYAWMTKTSYQSMWSLLNLYQLILLLAASGVYLPLKIRVLVEAMIPALFSSKYYGCNDSSLIRDIFSMWEIPQTSTELNLIGLESGSTLMNTLLASLFVVLMIFTQLSVWPFQWCWKTPDQEDGCWKKCTRGFFSLFNFGLYIRFLLETCLVYFITCLYEINEACFSFNHYSLSLVLLQNCTRRWWYSQQYAWSLYRIQR